MPEIPADTDSDARLFSGPFRVTVVVAFSSRLPTDNLLDAVLGEVHFFSARMLSTILIDVKMAASKQLAILTHCSASLKEMASAPTFARFTVAKSKKCRELSISEKS